MSKVRADEGPAGAAGDDAAVAPTDVWWLRSVRPLAALSGLLLWAALPRLEWWLLGWVATVPWLLLIKLPQLPGRRPYLWLWLLSGVHWLAVVEGVRHPHPALYGGWLLLAFYAAIYLPLFVAVARIAVHRLNWPLAVAAPLVWVGVELARGHVISGFSMALLGHTQVHWPALIQIADMGGAYAVSFLVLLISAGIAAAIPLGRPAQRPTQLRSLAIGLAAVAAAWGYGGWRLRQIPELASDDPQAKSVLVVQGGWNVFYEYDPDKNDQMFAAYLETTRRARQAAPDAELAIWPESSLPSHVPEFLLDAPGMQPTEWVRDYQRDFRSRLSDLAWKLNDEMGGGAERHPLTVLACNESVVLQPEAESRYNAAVLIDPQGRVVTRYYKMHLVMFGEYLPLGEWLPWLYKISPMSGGLSKGRTPGLFEAAGLRLSPSICFEITVPHLIRRQVKHLRAAGKMPDALVNMTNDGWFHGAAMLDHQAYCGVFRAVEHRRPLLISANGGLTMSIDAAGRIQQKLERQVNAFLVAHLRPAAADRPTLYQRWGDVFAGACLLASLVALLLGWRTGRRKS